MTPGCGLTSRRGSAGIQPPAAVRILREKHMREKGNASVAGPRVSIVVRKSEQPIDKFAAAYCISSIHVISMLKDDIEKTSGSGDVVRTRKSFLLLLPDGNTPSTPGAISRLVRSQGPSGIPPLSRQRVAAQLHPTTKERTAFHCLASLTLFQLATPARVRNLCLHWSRAALPSPS